MGHVARITMTAQSGEIIETVTTSEVWNIKMDNAAPKNIILSKYEPNEVLKVFNLERTPKSEGQTVG
jgi:DNA-directed RNA polymerase subunit H (RpoH/RPB5)